MKHIRLMFLILILAATSWLWGQNNALQFGSATPSPDYVNLTANQYNPIFNGLSGLTWEGWIRPSNVGTVSRVFHIGIIDPGTTAFAMEINANGSLTGYARSLSTDAAQAATSPAATVSNGSWYYVAVTVNFAVGQKSIKVYVNGTEVAANNSPAFANPVYTQGAAHTHIDLFGAYLPSSDPRGFQGLMDEFRFWNYAKTQAQVQSDMYKKLVGTESGLLGLWKFDENSGTIADEVTTYNKNGTLVNFPANPWTSGVANLYAVPTTQATGINTNNVSATSQTVLWDNGNGSSRIVVMNTTNSFTDPVNGTDPVADDSWNNAGQQVIYNGNGSSVTVTDLDMNSTYWYRVYEYNGSGVYTIYQIASALENPIEGDVTLPIELSSFTAIPNAQYFVELHWITQSETNVAGFRVYRSNTPYLEDAEMFSTFVEAHNTSDTQFYTFIDEEIYASGTYYYWLENVDMTGNTQFHGPEIATVTYGDPNTPPEIPAVENGIQKIFPNPFNPTANIMYTLVEDAAVSVNVYNLRGQLISNVFSGTKQAGTHTVAWNGVADSGTELSSGIYTVTVKIGNKLHSQRVVLSK